MKKINLLSCVLVLLFMVSCMTFFGVSAEPEGESTAATTAEHTTEAKKTTVATTKAATTTTFITTTTMATTTKAKTTKKTKKVTAADPVYTTKKATQSTNAATAGIVTAATTTERVDETKQTKEINTTEEITEPTTAAKNIVDYGSKYRPIKWLSLVVMIGCIIALVAVNLRYRKKYGKTGGKSQKKQPVRRNAAPKLDTSARFTEPKKPVTPPSYQRNQPDENLEKTTVVDISSFSNKAKQDSFKPKTEEKDEIFNTKNDDDDLYI